MPPCHLKLPESILLPWWFCFWVPQLSSSWYAWSPQRPQCKHPDQGWPLWKNVTSVRRPLNGRPICYQKHLQSYLMAEILHHLRVTNTCKSWDIRGSSTYLLVSQIAAITNISGEAYDKICVLSATASHPQAQMTSWQVLQHSGPASRNTNIHMLIYESYVTKIKRFHHPLWCLAELPIIHRSKNAGSWSIFKSLGCENVFVANLILQFSQVEGGKCCKRFGWLELSLIKVRMLRSMTRVSYQMMLLCEKDWKGTCMT